MIVDIRLRPLLITWVSKSRMVAHRTEPVEQVVHRRDRTLSQAAGLPKRLDGADDRARGDHAASGRPQAHPIYDACVHLDRLLNVTLSAAVQMPARRACEDSSPIPLHRLAKDFSKLVNRVAHMAVRDGHDRRRVRMPERVWISPDQYMISQIFAAQGYVRSENRYFHDPTLFGTAYHRKQPDGGMLPRMGLGVRRAAQMCCARTRGD